MSASNLSYSKLTPLVAASSEYDREKRLAWPWWLQVLLLSSPVLFHNDRNFARLCRSGYWPIAVGGKAQPGQGAAIQGVRGFSLSNVAGDLVPKAGNIQWASDVRLANISATVMKHGFSCGSNASDVELDGQPLAKCGGRYH